MCALIKQCYLQTHMLGVFTIDRKTGVCFEKLEWKGSIFSFKRGQVLLAEVALVGLGNGFVLHKSAEENQ